jgi:hypothetical protein
MRGRGRLGLYEHGPNGPRNELDEYWGSVRHSFTERSITRPIQALRRLPAEYTASLCPLKAARQARAIGPRLRVPCGSRNGEVGRLGLSWPQHWWPELLAR